ncbi:MAG: alpha/beta hydrolase [Deltaproteobacteria bacterium]|nr:MAG: alpha/beta hydrolase [Deltaproteobacteria bacterium]
MKVKHKAQEASSSFVPYETYAPLQGQPIEPPTMDGLWREGLGVASALAGLAVRWPLLSLGSKGNNETVWVFPGFRSGDASTWLLRNFLRRRGFAAEAWGLGFNDGNVWELIPQAAERLQKHHTTTGEKVFLVGWSLGGFLAREAARECPEAVHAVVTFGTPVIGGPKYSLAAETYRNRGYDVDMIEAEVEERSQVPLLVPVTAILSKNDEIVAWQACVDHCHEETNHIEVSASHLGMGFSPQVFQLIAQQLVSYSNHR